MRLTEENIGLEDIAVRASDTDRFYDATIPFFFSSSQEVAGEHATLFGMGISEMYKKEMRTWVIVRTRMDFTRIPKWREKLTFETFPQKGYKYKLVGYNSDVIGFRRSIEPLLTDSHRRALILGTGGASKAVFHGLKQLGVESTFVSRTAKEGCITYADLTREMMDRYTVIVNTTPLGMFPNVDSCPDIPYEWLTPNHLLYDLLYNPDETLFMRRGKERGAVVKNGLEMLLLQAFAAWEIWNDKK